METDKIKQLNLENYDELDRLFEISSVKEEVFILREIRRKIAEKFESAINLLSSFLNPGSAFIDIHDARALDDKDHELVANILKSFSIVLKEHYCLEIESDDSAEKIFFKNALESYKKHIKDLKSIICKVKDSYNADEMAKEYTHYFG
ncbi:MAG: hypothetical protein ACMXX5_00510 [Candidatus Woesearchaeota archaeon]